MRCGIILPRCWLGFFSFLDKQCVEHRIKILKTFINFNVQGLRYFCGEQNNKPTASTQVVYRTTDNRRFWRAKRRMQWKGKYFLSGPNQSKVTIIPLKRDQKFPFRVNSQGQFCSQLNCWINKTTDLNRLTVVLNADRITLTFDNLENRSRKNSGLHGLV